MYVGRMRGTVMGRGTKRTEDETKEEEGEKIKEEGEKIKEEAAEEEEGAGVEDVGGGDMYSVWKLALALPCLSGPESVSVSANGKQRGRDLR